MKKAWICIAGAICLLTAIALAADKPAASSDPKDAVKTTFVKTAKMNARGRVVEISDKTVKIERSIKGNAEIMEFSLEKPVRDIAVNEFVKIAYSLKDGSLTASRVEKLPAVKPAGEKRGSKTKEKPASLAR